MKGGIDNMVIFIKAFLMSSTFVVGVINGSLISIVYLAPFLIPNGYPLLPKWSVFVLLNIPIAMVGIIIYVLIKEYGPHEQLFSKKPRLSKRAGIF